MGLKESAARQMNIYFTVKELATKHGVEAVSAEIEDYGSDASYFDVYSENPERFVHDNDFRPSAPLTPDRRAYFKEQGFRFHRDGTVTYVGKQDG